MKCEKCRKNIEMVCLDCCVGICQCRNNRSHVLHNRQTIDAVLSKCEDIKVGIKNEDLFHRTKRQMVQATKNGIELIQELQNIQSTFTEMVQNAEYHCEMKRLSRKYQVAPASDLKDILEKILTKSKKCNYNLDDSLDNKENEKEDISLENVKDKIIQHEKVSKQLQEELKALQSTILHSKMLVIENLEEQALCKKRKSSALEQPSPMNLKRQILTDIPHSSTTPLYPARSTSPMITKKLKREFQNYY